MTTTFTDLEIKGALDVDSITNKATVRTDLEVLSSLSSSTQDIYGGDLYLQDDTVPSHRARITIAENLTADRILSLSLSNANRTLTLGGNLILGGSFTTSGASAVTFTTTGATALTLPTSGTILSDNSFSNITVNTFGLVMDGNAGSGQDGGNITFDASGDARLEIANFSGAGGILLQADSGNVAIASTSGDVSVTGSNSVVLTGGASSITIDTASGVAVSGNLSATNLTSGTYTPTLTNVANLAASTAYECQYMQVGATVTVSGKVDVDPTAGAASTQLGISLPIASNIGASEDCSGVAFASGIAGQGAAILGDAVNNRAQMQWVSGDVSNQPMFFTFSYQVI